MHMAQKSIEDSITEFKEIHKSYENLHGEFNPKTIEVQEVVAGLCFQNREYEKALKEYRDIYNFYENEYQIQHVKSIKTKENIAYVLLKLEQVEDALVELDVFYDFLIESCETDSDKTKTEEIINNSKLKFSRYLQKEKLFEESIQILTEVYSSNIVLHGPNSDETLKTKIKIGQAYLKQNKCSEALDNFYELLEIYENNPEFGDKILTLKTLIATTHEKNENYKEALELYFEIKKSYDDQYGEYNDHSLTIDSLISAALLREEKLDEALTKYNMIHTKYLENIGEENDTSLQIKLIIAHIFVKKENNEKALEIFQEAYCAYENLFSETDPRTVDVKASIAAVMLKEGLRNFSQSLNLYEDLLARFAILYGETHERTLTIKDILTDLKGMEDEMKGREVKVETLNRGSEMKESEKQSKYNQSFEMIPDSWDRQKIANNNDQIPRNHHKLDKPNATSDMKEVNTESKTDSNEEIDEEVSTMAETSDLSEPAHNYILTHEHNVKKDSKEKTKHLFSQKIEIKGVNHDGEKAKDNVNMSERTASLSDKQADNSIKEQNLFNIEDDDDSNCSKRKSKKKTEIPKETWDSIDLTEEEQPDEITGEVVIDYKKKKKKVRGKGCTIQ